MSRIHESCANDLSDVVVLPLVPKNEPPPVLQLGVLIILLNSTAGLTAKGVVDGQGEG